jgi:hypothetical protein
VVLYSSEGARRSLRSGADESEAVSYSRWVKQRVAVTNSDWTPITPAHPREYFAMRCDSSAIILRTDKDDPDTEDAFGQYAEESVMGSGIAVWDSEYGTAKSFRFPAGVPVCWVKSVEATATVVVTWVT